MSTKPTEHVLARYLGVVADERDFYRPPRSSLSRDFRVLVFPPSARIDAFMFVTSGLCDGQDGSSFELLMASPVDTSSIVELLFAVSDYHQVGNSINLGHTVNFGRPWLEGSSCDYGLVSFPYLLGDDFAVFCADTQPTIYWLLPITKRERDYKAQNGLDALEGQFERAALEYLDPRRASVV